MSKHLLKVISLIILIPSLILGGCTAPRVDTEEPQGLTTGTESEIVEEVPVGSAGNDLEILNLWNEYSMMTKNTSRVMGTSSEEVSISTSRMIWPASQEGNRPKVVLIAPSESWQTQLLAVNLIHHPSDGPLLITSRETLSDLVLSELTRLTPRGSTDGIQVITIGMSDNADQQLIDKGYKIKSIKADNIYKLAEDIDEYYTSISGEMPNSVIVSSSEDLAYALPAGNWIAHMPEPLLYVTKDEIPEEIVRALEKRNKKATIYLLGPESIINNDIASTLQTFGKVIRISGETPYANAIAFAKYRDKDTGFGWGITMPGHGLVLVSRDHVEDTIAATAFSHRGKHAPLLISDTTQPPEMLVEYLKELKPFFQTEPTEGPYTHLYIVGGKDRISELQQGDLDHLVEIEAGDTTGMNKMNH